jgi:hypothetical protein
MLHLLSAPTTTKPTASPLSFGRPVLNAYAKIADILRRATSLPPTVLPTPLPVSAPRVPIPPTPVASPRVPASLQPRAPTISIKHFPPSVKHTRPFSILDYHRVSPRFITHRPPRQHLVQSLQHDPTIASKMFNSSTGRADTIDSLLQGADSHTWTKSLINEWGRYAQGFSTDRTDTTKVVGNETIFFIPPHQVPTGRKVTYANFVCTMRPGKAEPYRIRKTVGGDQLDAYQDVCSPAVGITDTKLHINSTISDAKRGARYCTGDLKDFLLVSEMNVYQYMRVHRKYVPQAIIDEYELTNDYFDSKGYVYLEIRKGMYGLKEASILAYDQLKEHLALYGYAPVRFTPGLWKHNTRRMTFTLAVDDFGIKYFPKEDADHLFAALHDKYELTKDWSGTSYI